MLGGMRLKVAFTHERSCFAYLSPKYNSKTEQVSFWNEFVIHSFVFDAINIM